MYREGRRRTQFVDMTSGSHSELQLTGRSATRRTITNHRQNPRDISRPGDPGANTYG
jgi:hypothetical protein